MNAVNLILGLVFVAFGSWRIVLGLYTLDLIEQRAPGLHLFVRDVPWWMRKPTGVNGVVDILIGLVFAVSGALAVLVAF